MMFIRCQPEMTFAGALDQHHHSLPYLVLTALEGSASVVIDSTQECPTQQCCTYPQCLRSR